MRGLRVKIRNKVKCKNIHKKCVFVKRTVISQFYAKNPFQFVKMTQVDCPEDFSEVFKDKFLDLLA
jgi:hypothetical protein